MTVGERARDHLRRLGSYKAESHGAALSAHLALSPGECLARSVALMRRFFSTTAQRHDDPSPFFDRARRLGLYRP